MPLNFKKAERVRDKVIKDQKVKVKILFEDVAQEVEDMAEKIQDKNNLSSVFRRQQLMSLKKQIDANIDGKNAELKEIITDGMNQIVTEMQWCTVEWLKSVGFEQANAYAHVPTDLVKRIVDGKIYNNGWNLSKAIWSSNKKIHEDLYTIVAKGLAKNSSIAEISKELEAYVRPGRRLPWNQVTYEGRVYKIYNKKVDYNAQRLARTLSQHAYQQSYDEETIKNPFVEKTKWIANGSRACSLCKERDGQLYDKGNVPLDHPQGMCIMEPVMSKSDAEIRKEILEWYKNGPGTNPSLDVYSKYIRNNSEI